MVERSDIPLAARVELAHAEIQAVARAHGIDVLLVKGYAADPRLYVPGRVSSDVDVLTRPSHAQRMIRALTDDGWETVSTFSSGSIFQHAPTMRHPTWGLVDVHRFFPGFEMDPADVFERFWGRRATRTVAGYPCEVPDIVDHALLIVVHAARSPEAIHQDVGHFSTVLTERDWTTLAVRARALQASVAFAAATGRLPDYQDQPTHDLWLTLSQHGSKSQEWRARVKAAATWAAKLRVILRAPLPNVDHLRMDLSREPTALDIAAATARRPLIAVKDLLSGRASPHSVPRGGSSEASPGASPAAVTRGAEHGGATGSAGPDQTSLDTTDPEWASPNVGVESTHSWFAAALAPGSAHPDSQDSAPRDDAPPPGLQLAQGVAWVDLAKDPDAPDGVCVARVPGGAPLVLNDSAALIWRQALVLPEAAVAPTVAVDVAQELDDSSLEEQVNQFLAHLVASGFLTR